MGRGIGRDMFQSMPRKRSHVRAMGPIAKTRLLFGIIFSVTGLVLIILSLFGIGR